MIAYCTKCELPGICTVNNRCSAGFQDFPAPQMTNEELLAEMQAQYKYARLDTHMLVNGVIHLRCGVCRKNPVPENAGSVLWCEDCLDEALSNNESLDLFVERKRAENR